MTPAPSPSLPPAHEPDELASHLAFVRRLARSLVHGEAAADDLAQETIAMALERPPRIGFGWRDWLAGIARRLAWRKRRSDERRARREREGAWPSSAHAPAAAETAALLELSQRVVQELAQLDEPYATTVRRRFLDGLSADAIARLEGVPVETVRTRIKRALQRLRERLDAAHGGDRAAWAGVIGSWAGGVVMSAKAKLAIAALVIAAAGGAGWWGLREEPSLAEPRVAASAAIAERADPSAAISREQGAAAEGTEVEATREVVGASVVTAAVDPLGIVLQGRLHHPEGAPFEGVEVHLDGASAAIASATANVDSDGAFAFSGLAAGRWRLRVREVEGCEPLMQWIDVAPAPGVQCVDLALRSSILLTIRLVTSEGGRLLDTMDPERRFKFSRGLAFRTSASPLPRELAPNPWASSRSRDGRYFWMADGSTDLGREPSRLKVPAGCDGLLPVRALPCHVGVYFKHVLLHSVAVESAEVPLSLTVDPEEVDELRATVTARLVDAESGTPLQGGPCDLSDRQGGSRGVRPDREGVVHFENVAPGLLYLHLMPGRHATLSRFVRVDPGAELDLGEIRVPRAVPIAGRVVDEAGRPVERVTVQWFLLDALTPDQPIDSMEVQGSDKDGNFTLHWAAKARILLCGRNYDPTDRRVIEPQVVDASNGVPESLTLVARSATPLRIELGDTFGEPVTVRIERGDGLPFDWVQIEGPVDWPQALPPGSWRFVVDHPRRGTRIVDVNVGLEPLVVPIVLDGAPVAAPLDVVAAHPCDDGPAPVATAMNGEPSPTSAARSLLLFGSVVDGSGRPVRPESIVAIDGAGKRHSGSSTAAGGYAVAGLPAGECDLSIEAKGFVQRRESLLLAADAAQVRKDLILQRKVELPVRFVAPDGRPLHEAVRASPPTHRISAAPLTLLVTRGPLAEPPLAGRRVDRASEAGRFRRDSSTIRRSFDGTLEIEGELPVVVTAAIDRKVVRTVELATLPEELVLAIEPAEIDAAAASVAWRVADALTGAPVTLSHLSLGDAFGESSSGIDAFVQPDGSLRAAGLHPGTFRLSIQSAGHPNLEMRLLLAPGEHRDLGTIQLPPEARVTGRFVDERGEPARTRYRVRTAEPLEGIGVFGAYDSGEAKEGAFEIVAGRTELRITVNEDPWAWQSTSVDPTNGSVEGLVIPLAVGTRVRLAVEAEPWRAFQATVLDVDGNRLGEAWIENGAPKRFALRPGRYRIALAEDGADRGEHELVVGTEPASRTIALR